MNLLSLEILGGDNSDILVRRDSLQVKSVKIVQYANINYIPLFTEQTIQKYIEGIDQHESAIDVTALLKQDKAQKVYNNYARMRELAFANTNFKDITIRKLKELTNARRW